MGLKQQLFFITVSAITLFFVIRKIRKHKMNIDDSIIWFMLAFIMLLFSVFPQIPTFFSNLFGFISPSNFIICLFVFFAFVIIFFQTIHISMLKEKNKALIQKLSLKDGVHINEE